jgi:hypothetical protein
LSTVFRVEPDLAETVFSATILASYKDQPPEQQESTSAATAAETTASASRSTS